MKTRLKAGAALPMQTRLQSDSFESPLKLVNGICFEFRPYPSHMALP
jgi:hypothetical protein